MLTNNGELPFDEVKLDQVSDKYIARKTRIFVSGIDTKVAGNYGKVVDNPADADIAIMRVDAVNASSGAGFDETTVDISFPDETMAMINAVAETGVPTVVAMNISSSLAVFPKELFDKTAGTFVLFDVLDNALLDVVFGRFNPVGKLPFDLPSSMEAVENQLEDVPFDTEDPLFKFGHGLSY